MQIDFHHTVIFVLARLAGFNLTQANLIARCSQYVDEAESSAIIHFKNGASFKPVCSAHSHLDYTNFNILDNSQVWIPFHFLPANYLLPPGQGLNLDFYTRILCLPNSPIAQEILKDCLKQKNTFVELYRLGVTLHVWADTWAHQGFAGIQHENNKVSNLKDSDNIHNLQDAVIEFFDDRFDTLKNQFVENLLPLGHAAILTYPDLPYLKWSYQNYAGQLIQRDNTAIFLDCIQKIYIFLQQFQNQKVPTKSLSPDYLKIFQKLFSSIQDEDPEIRHQKWIHLINQDKKFGDIGPVNYQKIQSWQDQALKNLDNPNDFYQSSWKHFNIALKQHKNFSTDILDNYQICIA